MKMPWNNPFRRKSITETELRHDYPTDSESEITDDDRRREKWQRQPGATPSGGGEEQREQETWEYFSEYNASFSSDDSIIDAYREHARQVQHGDREFENVYERAEKEETSYNERERKEVKKNHLSPPGLDIRHRPPSPCSIRSREPPRSPMIREKIMALEHGANGKRRASCYPADAGKTSAGKTSSENIGWYSTWNTNRDNAKKRHRKPTKQRRRACENKPDYSEDESTFTVNLSLDELNNIIKKNVSSAMKTITSATTQGRKNGPVLRSPTDSFSTETETMFSGSSSHSTELPPGILSKQMKAQLDKDMLRGHRRMSLAPVMAADIEGGRRPPNAVNFSINPLQTTHTMQNIHPNVYGITQQPEFPRTPYLSVMQNATTPVPPAPPPPPGPMPQVTFNLPTAGYSAMDTNQLPPSQTTYEQDLMYGGIPPAALGRLQSRRHTLASLGHENLLSELNDNFESKLEQVSKAIRLLDTNINKDENLGNSQKSISAAQDTDNTQKTTEPTPEPITSAPNTDNATHTGQLSQGLNVFAPVLSIADQIKALSKKPKKELKPGQIKMAGWVRGLLIFTNVVFLISGCGLIGLGIWMLMDANIETYFAILNVDKTSADFKLICYALIGVGTFITFIGFMGCCGGIKSNKCMLSVFIVTVGVITIAEAGLAAMVIFNLDSPSAIPIVSAIFEEVEGNLLTQLKRSLIEKYVPDTLIGTTWDYIQIHLECCGATGPDDYKVSAWKNDTTNELTIPDTCCKLVSKTAEVPEPSNKLLCQMGTVGFFHDTGCYDMMIGWFKNNSKYIVAGGVTTLCIEVFSFIFALIICRKAVADDKKHKGQRGLH